MQRSLKKLDSPIPLVPVPAPSPQVVVSSAVAENENDEEEEYPEEILVVEGDNNQENNNGKDDNRKDDKTTECSSDGVCISLVKLPELFVVVGVQVSTSSRDGSYAIPRNNYDALEALIEEYFEGLLTQDILGTNYVTSDLDAKLFTTQYFNDQNGAGTLLFFEVKGKAEYEGDSAPDKQSVRDWLVAFFIDWGYDDDLGLFLADQGIEGAKVANLFVEGNQMPAFYNSNMETGQTQEEQSQQDQFQQEQTWLQATPAPGPSTSTTTSSSANAVVEEPTKKGKPMGLIIGLMFFFVCLGIAALLIVNARRYNDKRKELFASRGWHGFGSEDGSETSPEREDSQSEADQSKSKKNGWGAWFHRSEKKMEREPSKILGHIQVVVENDHVLKEGKGCGNRTNPEDCSGALHSAETLPHSNYGEDFKIISPQGTEKTSFSEEESLADPVVRWGPPTRSTSKMYNKERRHTPKEDPAVVSPITEGSHSPISPARNGCRTPAPAPLEDEDCAGLVEWASSLNPCMLPSNIFKYESDRLDDIVANLPRNKSIFDANISNDDSAPIPSPPRRSPGRRQSHRRSASGRKRSGHHHSHIRRHDQQLHETPKYEF
jgi:hypothetical protein